MTEDFQMYFNLGLKHVLDWKAYDHVLFLIVLTIFYSFKDWKKSIVANYCFYAWSYANFRIIGV